MTLPINPNLPTPEPHGQIERKAKLLLLLVALLFLGFVCYVLYARGVFQPSQQLVLVTNDSEGVTVGSDLTFAGFPIGRVRRIALAPDGQVRLLIDVPLQDARWLRSSSVFTLERGMVGDTRIRAYSGILSDPPLPDGAERHLLRGDISAEIPRIVASARALLENLEKITAPEAHLNQTLAQLQRLSEKINGRYGVLTGVLGSEAQAQKVVRTLDQTNALLSQTEQRVFGPQGLMDSTQATVSQLHDLLTDTRASLLKLDAVLVQAEAVGANVRVASSDLGALRSEVEASLRKVSQLADEINRKWPFARDTELRLP
jgi:phospholipid/cholesterol/gamma-HCH transport system substrate-binding protein